VGIAIKVLPRSVLYPSDYIDKKSLNFQRIHLQSEQAQKNSSLSLSIETIGTGLFKISDDPSVTRIGRFGLDLKIVLRTIGAVFSETES
jgi:hypothetical protein